MLKDDKKKLDNQTEDKPWESQFDDDRDDRGNLSRVASKSKEKGNTYFAIILGVLLVLMIASPIIAYTIHSSRANRPTDTSHIVVSSSDSDSSSKKAAKKAKAASESQKKAAASESEAAEKAASEKAATEASQQAAAKAASESQAQAAAAAQSSSAAVQSSSSTTNSTTESTSGAGTYTLKSGEGLYRAAVNNGLTLKQLLALNPGLTANSNVAPGTALKIK